MASYVEALVRILLAHNSGPSPDERQLIPGEAHTTPCRAFYATCTYPPRLTYITAAGRTNTRRVVPHQPQPIRITQLLAIEPHPREPAAEPVEVWAVW